MSTPAQTLSRAREQLSDAKAQDERSAEVLRSSQATLATLRSSIRDMNARTTEREETLSASAQLEARWKDFQDRFDQVLTKLADNVGKAIEARDRVHPIEILGIPANRQLLQLMATAGASMGVLLLRVFTT